MEDKSFILSIPLEDVGLVLTIVSEESKKTRKVDGGRIEFANEKITKQWRGEVTQERINEFNKEAVERLLNGMKYNILWKKAKAEGIVSYKTYEESKKHPKDEKKRRRFFKEHDKDIQIEVKSFNL